MSSSKSYLYGRPVTEWSTPPPLSSKAQTTLLHKEAPAGRQPTTFSDGTIPTTRGLPQSDGGTDPHNISWQPLAALPTSSHSHHHTHPPKPPTTHTHRHSIPNTTVAEFKPLSHQLTRSLGVGPINRMHTRTHTAGGTSTASHAPRVTHHEDIDSSSVLNNPLLHATLPHSDPSHSHTDSPSQLHYPLKRSMSDRQIHKSIARSNPALHSSSTDIKTTFHSDTKPPPTSGTPQPPMAYVAPLLDTVSKPSMSESSKIVQDGSHTLSKPSRGGRIEETDYAVPAWDSMGEKERIKKMTESIVQAPKMAGGGVPLSHDYRVSTGDLLGSAEKWKTVIETKDRIMAQKNQLIERQKQTISRLQQEVREGEAQLHQLASARAQEEGGTALTARLRALESKNASLKVELSKTLSAKNSEIDHLSKKLDATEYELQKTVSEFAKLSEQAKREKANLKEEVHTKTDLLKQVDDKMVEVNAKNHELNEHIAKLNTYLGDMPTMEEHQALQEQVRDLRVQCEQVTSQLREKEALLEDTCTSVHYKDDLLSQLEREIANVKQELCETRLKLEEEGEKVASLEPENYKLTKECKRLQKLVFQADDERRSELQAMRDRHKQRFTEATAKLRSQHKALGKRVRALETQLLKNSDAMIALNSELQLSQGTIGDLKTSVKELVGQNQELVEKNITLQEATAEATKVAVSISEAQSASAQQLAMELTRCVDDFDSLITLSSSILEGKDPSASLVLGVRGGSATGGDETDSLASGGGFESQLEQVRRLQAEVERLRTVVSDQFATQVCTACNVQ